MSPDFLGLSGKTFLVFGVANRKSVAYSVASALQLAGANIVHVVRSEQRRQTVAKLLASHEIHVCDVESPEQIEQLRQSLTHSERKFDGLVHSIAFADYAGEAKPFHETSRSQFLRAVDISCFSLVALCNALKDLFVTDASVVTISISTTRMASENYGFMGPVKAALDSTVVFLAKSFSRFSRIRFNAVGPGLLKTSASAGIPGYVDSYLYAEKVIPRHQAVQTGEAANVVVFLLSPRSSGINAQTIVVDAGMSINYFDREIVQQVMRSQS